MNLLRALSVLCGKDLCSRPSRVLSVLRGSLLDFACKNKTRAEARVQSRRPTSDGRFLNPHHSHFLLHFRGIDHDDGVPRTAIQKTPVRPLADAFLAANA